MKTLDVCGLSCPEPVVRTRAALKTLGPDESLTVLADTATARDNIIRTVAELGLDVSVETEGRQYRLAVRKR